MMASLGNFKTLKISDARKNRRRTISEIENFKNGPVSAVSIYSCRKNYIINPRRRIGGAVTRTSDIPFSSLVCYRLTYTGSSTTLREKSLQGILEIELQLISSSGKDWTVRQISTV